MQCKFRLHVNWFRCRVKWFRCFFSILVYVLKKYIFCKTVKKGCMSWKCFFLFFNLYFVNRKLKMWTKVVFFTCVNSSSFTWVIVIAYLRYLERLFSVRFWHLGLLVFKLFTWDEVISTDMKVIDWYISYSSGNKYLVVNIGSIQMRSKLNRCKIIFSERK